MPEFESLVQLLTELVPRVQYNSEAEQADMGDLLRQVEDDLGVSGVVPPEREEPGAAPPATTAVENPGMNGDFQPSGCETPTVAEMTSLPVTAEPDTAWGAGSYMSATDGEVYWDGAAWAADRAPGARTAD